MTAVTTNTVRLVVYDLSGGMARQLGASLLGMNLDCLPHTGVVVFGQEYFFGKYSTHRQSGLETDKFSRRWNSPHAS